MFWLLACASPPALELPLALPRANHARHVRADEFVGPLDVADLDAATRLSGTRAPDTFAAPGRGASPRTLTLLLSGAPPSPPRWSIGGRTSGATSAAKRASPSRS